MSDSEDDMSGSGSDVEEDDVEMDDLDNETAVEGDDEGPTSEGEVEDESGVAEEADSTSKWFHKEMWQLKKLPYSKDLEEQANNTWGEIKAGLAYAILLNDHQIGLMQWIYEIERYIERFGRRFPKEDHILLVKTLYKMVKPKELFRDIKVKMHVLNLLLGRRDFLVRTDITLDWEPLFLLYKEVMFCNLEEDGLFLLPDGFKTELNSLIFFSRCYFSDNAPQEILDTMRPFFCHWDENIVRAWKMLDLFMPTNFPAALQATKGAGLWLDEAWHWYTILENNSLIETYIVKMFARLSYESPGYANWTDKLDIMFAKVVRSLRLGTVVGLCQNFPFEHGTLFFSYLLNTQAHEATMEHLKILFKLVESYVHPSNHGNHSAPIILFMQKFLHNVTLRVKRERGQKTNKQKTCNPIPESMKLNQDILNALIELMLPCIKLLIFSKINTIDVSIVLRNACALAPKIVLPTILDVVYPALDILTEPHRLLQALQALVCTSPNLVKDDKYRIHVISLLNHLLPGLDKNDMAKSMLTFQFVGITVNLVPIVDCSEAIHLRNDLTEEEKDLCSATANFESIIGLFMDKLLGMLLELGESANHTGQHGSINSKTRSNIEDSILHRGTISVFKGIFRNSSTELYKFAVDRIYRFIEENVFDSKVVCDAVGDMIYVANRCYPELSFPRFFKLILRNLKEILTPEIYLEEKPEFQLMWWLSLASRVVKVSSKCLLSHWDEVLELLELVMPFSKANDATDRVCMLMENIVESLCNLYVEDTCRKRKNYDKSTEEYLAIRHWSEPVDKNTWEMQWYIPTQDAINKAEHLFKKYFTPNVEALKSPVGMDKKEVLVRLWRIRHMISGASYSIPLFDGPVIKLTNSPITFSNQHLVCKPKGTPELTLNGESIRDITLDMLTTLMSHIEENSEDDVKSLCEIIILLNGIENFRGISREVYNQSVQNYKVTKLILSDRISANKDNIEMICEDYIYLQHKMRVASLCGHLFREQNIRIIKMLIKLSTSFYSQVRGKAQQVVLNIIKEHPYSYKLFLGDICSYLDADRKPTHEQLKGALHLLVEGRRHAIVMRASFENQLQTWSAIILAKHSEKPSIIQLLETAQNTIVDGYESYRLEWKINKDIIPLARKLLEQKAGSPVNPPLGLPSNAEIEANAQNLEKHSAYVRTSYFALIDKLLELSLTSGLHWKHVDMAQAMQSLLVRRDISMPTNTLKNFLRLCVNDSIKTRKMATAVIASWLKINKPKAIKINYIEKMGPMPADVCVPSKWPIRYGIREDNRSTMYEEDKLPKTDEEWNNFQFCNKQHWGFYCWPKKLKTYAPLKDQVNIDRPQSEWSSDDKLVWETISDPEYMKKLKIFFTVEEKKGEDMFNAVNFTLFNGLARNYNDAVCPLFEQLLSELIPSTREADHRLAAEMIAGLINGSKLWKYERKRHMWNWLSSLFTRALENVKNDNMRNWGVCLGTICGSSEARLLKPVMDIIFSMLEKPTDSAYVANSRLFLVQGALCQFEWRVMELWNRFNKFLQKSMISNYANLRERIAICMVSSIYYDIPSVTIENTIPASLRPPSAASLIDAYSVYLGPCWDETKLCSSDGIENETEVKKQARLAMKGYISYANNLTLTSYVAIFPSLLKTLPLFCHYSNDIGEEELQKSCAKFVRELLRAVYINEGNLQNVINVADQILKSQDCWWKAKVAFLGILQSLIVANLYEFIKHKTTIGEIICLTLCDNQIEVRETGATTFSNLVLSGFFDITQSLVDKFINEALSTEIRLRHGGVLGLSAIVLASPYSVPSHLPNVLMKLCRFATEKNPIKDTVKRTLSEFKRTHLDSWREHEAHFNEDQLCVLRDLLISPNYYV